MGCRLVNFHGEHGEPGDEADRARAWSPAVYERRRGAKSSYAPGNRLRFGHTITGMPSYSHRLLRNGPYEGSKGQLRSNR